MPKLSLFFDLDGTLCDPREGIIRCLKYALAELAYPSPPENQLERYIGPPLFEIFATLLNSCDAELAGRAVEVYRQRFAAKGMFENKLYNGIEDALTRLQEEDFCLYVVTSKPTVFAHRVLRHLRLQRFFQNVFGSELDGARSTKEELIAYALAEEEIPATDAVMIGDRGHDVKGALVNGVTAVGVLWGYGSREELTQAGASLLCDRPQVLAEIMTKLRLQ
jgi:phosphoglycolate phosphatase